MCRHVAYLGPPATLAQLLLDPAHSLALQATEPRHQTHGRRNTDGFGVGWYDHGVRPQPARYRRAGPIGADASFASVAGLVATGALLAAVRSASPGMALDESASAPFTDGVWLFSHNGIVTGFHDGIGDELGRAVAGSRAWRDAAATDSGLLFALTLDRLDAGADPVAALADVVKRVASVTEGRLNLLLTDGDTVAATAWGNSLFTSTNGDAVFVASEPHDDDDRWERVADRSLVSARAGAVTVTPL